ncbi:MAG: hypothetical protein CVT88_04075 [Candidatus Altiarchaeales archaeon HGW-Altiarchaeales-1]|nr:MAG: hypothetical protein CVT89_04935 [Candidatus Altiarchaeales archaeon HGW-Altiarchaeales-2]PKP60044.1 MAG: hypothetical protein CVT88_04075 [Candidatus Altiarchaeales archaeon HGW-Altiarchaeales-1]
MSKQEYLNDLVKSRTVITSRLWIGTIAFTTGIGGLVFGGFYFHASPIIYWIVSGGGAVLIAIGLYLASTC